MTILSRAARAGTKSKRGGGWMTLLKNIFLCLQYSYRRYGRRKRSALVEVAEWQSKYGANKDQWYVDVSTMDKVYLV
jgi:hypothetical protein